VTTKLEIAVTSDATARLALEGGADRVELCSALETDGITPSAALLDATVATGAPTHVLIRIRPGDFVYDADEVRVMAADAALAIRAGAAGVVIGALRRDGALDFETLETIAAAARGEDPRAEVTIHRAVDVGAHSVRNAAALAASALAPTRILTSGGGPVAGEALDILAEAVAVAGPVQIMAGGGVSPQTIPALIATGVAAVHLSAKKRAGDHWTIDPAIVAAARAAVDANVLDAGGVSSRG
jgi:copper homeostasis protein